MKAWPLLMVAAATAALSLTAAADGFSGPYAGIYAGQVQADDKGKSNFQGSGVTTGFSQKTSPEPQQYGLLGGYNWELGNNLLLGLEADYEGRSNGDDKTQQKFNGISFDDTEATELKSAASLRGRAGYIFNQQALVYATAGYAAVEAKRTYKDTFEDVHESSTDWQDGWTAGAGVEYLINANFSTRLEYRYADYGTEENIDVDMWDETYKQDLTEQSLRLGASYQF